MKAALVLTLEDKLSAGLKGVKDVMSKVKQEGKDLTLGKLEEALKPVEKLGNELKSIASDLRQVSSQADHAQSRLSRLGQSIRGIGSSLRQGMFGQHEAQNARQRGGLVGAGEAVAGGVAVAMPVMKFADYEDTLRHIAISENLSGTAAKTEIDRLTKVIN